MDIETLKLIAAIVTPILLFFLGIGVGAIAYFLRNIHSDINMKFAEVSAEFAETDKKIDRVDHDFMEFKAQIPTRYVLKDDYIRTISGFEFKVDELVKKVDQLILK